MIKLNFKISLMFVLKIIRISNQLCLVVIGRFMFKRKLKKVIAGLVVNSVNIVIRLVVLDAKRILFLQLFRVVLVIVCQGKDRGVHLKVKYNKLVVFLFGILEQLIQKAKESFTKAGTTLLYKIAKDKYPPLPATITE